MFIKLKVGKETLALRGQDNCFEICRFNEHTRKASGKADGWQAYLWYSTLEGAFKALLRLKIARSNVDSIHSLIAEIKKAKDELSGLYG